MKNYDELMEICLEGTRKSAIFQQSESVIQSDSNPRSQVVLREHQAITAVGMATVNELMRVRSIRLALSSGRFSLSLIRLANIMVTPAALLPVYFLA